MTYDKPLPDVTNPRTEPFWAALRDRRLTVQRCPSCHALRYPAATICPECLTTGGEWTDISPHGTLWSYIVYHRALSAAFADDIPYAVGVVEVEDRLHVLARIDAPLEEISIGAAMEARFADVTDNVTLLRWGLRLRTEDQHA